MYLSIGIADEQLLRHLAVLLAKDAPTSYTLSDLALLYIVKRAFDLRVSSPSQATNCLGIQLKENPVDALRKIKITAQNTVHRVVEIDSESTALLSSINSGGDDDLQIMIVSNDQEVDEHEFREPKNLSTDLISSIQEGFENAGAKRMANQLSRQLLDGEHLEEYSELPLPLLFAIAQLAWPEANRGEEEEQRYSENLSRILRASSAQVLRASLVFSIPGIGPAVAALLFANRLERAK